MRPLRSGRREPLEGAFRQRVAQTTGRGTQLRPTTEGEERGGFLIESSFTEKGWNVLVQILAGALDALPGALGNMLAVFCAALVSVLAVSFFRGETTVFRNPYLLIMFLTGTLNPILGLLGGTSTVLLAHRRREQEQRESWPCSLRSCSCVSFTSLD
jgi:hypothetical protein